jgi:hypothetical protein
MLAKAALSERTASLEGEDVNAIAKATDKKGTESPPKKGNKGPERAHYVCDAHG